MEIRMDQTILAFKSETQLRELVAAYGTPLLFLSKSRLQGNLIKIFQAWKTEFGSVPQFYFPLKTNDCDPYLESLVKSEMGVEVSSLKELKIAIDVLQIKPTQIVASGPAKDNLFLKCAVEHGVVINIDGLSEIQRLYQITTEYQKVANVGIRLRLQGTNQFGLACEDDELKHVFDFIRKNSLHFRFVQIHQHNGEILNSRENIAPAIRQMVKFSMDYSDAWNCSKMSLNLGGGFELCKDKPNSFGSYSEFASCIRGICDGIDDFDNRFTLAFEWGREIINSCGMVIARVVSVKHSAGKEWIFLDAGQFNLGGQAGIVYNKIVVLGKQDTQQPRIVQIVGPHCASSDVIAKDFEIATNIQEGDVFVICNTGAYTIDIWNGYSNNPMVLLNEIDESVRPLGRLWDFPIRSR
jgi:diaminopimelate decarboxylase